MPYATDHIATTLKAAREAKGLSQRALSQAAGVPQGHISKIENVAVDLRLSSLIALARALDLELTLVPRKTVPAVQSVMRSSERVTGPAGEEARLALKELKRMQKAIANFVRAKPAPEELAQVQRQIRDLQHFAQHVAVPNPERLREANRALRAFLDDTRNLDAIRESRSSLSELRNALAHGSAHAPQTEIVRPAYSLDEDDHA
jgi:transcriptional regulator with XRE-family HTH domain